MFGTPVSTTLWFRTRNLRPLGSEVDKETRIYLSVLLLFHPENIPEDILVEIAQEAKPVGEA